MFKRHTNGFVCLRTNVSLGRVSNGFRFQVNALAYAIIGIGPYDFCNVIDVIGCTMQATLENGSHVG